MRYEVRFYDQVEQVTVTVELFAADRRAAEGAARDYLRTLGALRYAKGTLRLGVVVESPARREVGA